MKNRLISKIKRTKKAVACAVLRQRVKNRDFTIVSIDCWGSSIYQEMNLPYNTPFVGLFFFAPCYLKLLSDLRCYLDSELAFISDSKYPSANQKRLERSDYYPIGVLRGDVEIHFLHYKDQAEAHAKWSSRLRRMNMENLFIEFSDRNLCEDIHIKKFDQLHFSHKVVFTARPHPEIKSAVCLSEFSGQSSIENIYIKRYIYKRHFDVADWLNGGTGKATFPYKVVNHLLEIPNKE